MSMTPTADDMAGMQARLAELEADNTRLKGLLEANPAVVRMEYTREDGSTVELEHWAVRHIAASLRESFRRDGGPNYFSIEVSGDGHDEEPPWGPLEVVIRPRWGTKTPVQLHQEAMAEVERLRSSVQDAQSRIDGAAAFLALQRDVARASTVEGNPIQARAEIAWDGHATVEVCHPRGVSFVASRNTLAEAVDQARGEAELRGWLDTREAANHPQTGA